MSEPDENGYPTTLKRWVDLLWPLEPLHYVGRASPAALLFQNGIHDEYVPASDSLRYQQAASEPKTILWYDAGHFLPKRHYYDHLIWQHERIGVESLLFRPLFSESGLIWDRLLLGWYALTAIAAIALVVTAAQQVPSNLRIGLRWIVISFFIGPFSLLAFWYLQRTKAQSDSSNCRKALEKSTSLTALLVLGIAVIQQHSFLTFQDWRSSLLPYYLLPPLVSILATLMTIVPIRSGQQYSKSIGLYLGAYLVLSTLMTASAYFLIEHVSMLIVHFHFPIFHPLKWFILMLSSLVLVLLGWVVFWALFKFRLMPATKMVDLPEAISLKRMSLPFGLSLIAYVLLFLVHVYHFTTETPIYISFKDIAWALLGLA